MSSKKIVVIDDFYKDPWRERDFAIKSSQYKFHESNAGFNGTIVNISAHKVHLLMKRIANVLHTNITYDPVQQGDYKFLTKLQYKKKSSYVHYDLCDWSGVLCLSSPEHIKGATKFWTHKKLNADGLYDLKLVQKLCDKFDCRPADLFARADRDSNKRTESVWKEVASVDHKFNRLILFRGNMFHSSSEGFGQTKMNSKLTQTFFFEDCRQAKKIYLKKGWHFQTGV